MNQVEVHVGDSQLLQLHLEEERESASRLDVRRVDSLCNPCTTYSL